MALAPPAEDLCLAFANTRYWRGRAEPTGTLAGYADLLTWLEKNSGSAPALLSRARHWATGHAAQSAQAAAEAIELRETIYRLFTAIADGKDVPARDLDRLNAALAEAPARAQLIRGATGFGWAANSDVPTIPALLAPALWSWADLLTYADNRRLRRCANDEVPVAFHGSQQRWDAALVRYEFLRQPCQGETSLSARQDGQSPSLTKNAAGSPLTYVSAVCCGRKIKKSAYGFLRSAAQNFARVGP